MKLASYFLLLFFAFSSVVASSLPAHILSWNQAFSLSTACSPMHIHVTVGYLVGDPNNPELIKGEKSQRQRELTALVKRRLVAARLYQERAENYVEIDVLAQLDGTFTLEFDFKKLLYDRATQSWDHASTWNIDLSPTESTLISALSNVLDYFLEQYVVANKNSCSP